MTRSPETGAVAPRTGDPVGMLLGERYELGARLGEGGMGVVYRAHDTMLRRTVAVKVFRDGATEAARTASETRLLAGLNHPALVTLYDAHVGAEEPRYLVMEYVDGPTLQSRLDGGPLSDSTVLRVAHDLGEALHAVHEAGIVHRDVKPANVLLRASRVPGEEFHAKLADFGIAYLIDTTRLTTPGTIIGSAAYLSPEQVTGVTPLPSSDIYSLGLVLLESLTGQRAFAQEGMREAVLARLTHDPAIPSSLGHGWGTLLAAMTAREPELRPSALDVVTGVRTLRASPSPTSSATVRLPAAATAPESAAATSSATRKLPAGTPSDPTLTRTAVIDPTADLESPKASPRPQRRKWLAAIVLAAVVAALVIGGFALWGPRGETAQPPVLPAVEEPLDSHLQQLLDAVSP